MQMTFSSAQYISLCASCYIPVRKYFYFDSNVKYILKGQRQGGQQLAKVKELFRQV